MRCLLAIAWMVGCGYAPPRIALDDSTIDAVDGPPGDEDNDGIETTTDNCPTVANPDQHDEDHDGIGDACDPCPHLTGPASNNDSDGDGIGDACDPRPSVADELVLFEPFAGTLAAGWTATIGTLANWTIVDDRLVNSALELTQQLELVVGAGPHTVDARIEITATNNTADTTGVGPMIDSDGGLANYYVCFANTVPGAFNQNLGPGSATFLSTMPGPVFPGRYRIVTSYDGANLHCRYEGLNQPPEQTSGQVAFGNTQIGFRLRNVAVRIEYVAVYRSP